MFGMKKDPDRKELAAYMDAKAQEYDGEAREHRSKIKALRKDLAKSTDKVAVRHAINDQDMNLRISEANARDSRTAAKDLRRPWWR